MDNCGGVTSYLCKTLTTMVDKCGGGWSMRVESSYPRWCLRWNSSPPGLNNKCYKCSKPPRNIQKYIKINFSYVYKKTYFFQSRVEITIQNITESPENLDFQDIFSGFAISILKDVFSRFAGF